MIEYRLLNMFYSHEDPLGRIIFNTAMLGCYTSSVLAGSLWFFQCFKFSNKMNKNVSMRHLGGLHIPFSCDNMVSICIGDIIHFTWRKNWGWRQFYVLSLRNKERGVHWRRKGVTLSFTVLYLVFQNWIYLICTISRQTAWLANLVRMQNEHVSFLAFKFLHLSNLYVLENLINAH